jgi:hypothetical protein
MRRMLLAAALAVSALTVSGCATLAAEPAAISDTTRADEQAMLAAENVYLAANNLANFAFDLNVLNPEQRERVKAADRDAYAALLRVRAAYRAANSKSLVAALNELNVLVEDILAVVRSR